MSSRLSLASASIACALLSMACEPEEVIPDRQDTDDGSDVHCGEMELGLSVHLLGSVRDAYDAPLAGVEVVLEDRNPLPHQDRGHAVTDDSGRFSFVASDLTYYHNCFNDVVDYWVVASLDAVSAERNVNRFIYTAFEKDTDAHVPDPLVLAPSP